MEKEAPVNTPDRGYNQNEEVLQFHPRDLHQIVHEYSGFSFCDHRQKVYYTGPQEDKDYLDDIMNRVRAYLTYSCNKKGYSSGSPGMIILS